MNDQELQLALAKMLPEKIIICGEIFRWTDRSSPRITPLEWLHVCWLVEITLGDKINQYIRLVEVSSPWQQRATALAALLEVEVV